MLDNFTEFRTELRGEVEMKVTNDVIKEICFPIFLLLCVSSCFRFCLFVCLFACLLLIFDIYIYEETEEKYCVTLALHYVDQMDYEYLLAYGTVPY